MRIDKTYNHDVATGATEIDAFEVPIHCKNITLQIFYAGLSHSDGTIEVKQSQQMNVFDDIVDGSGTATVITLASANTSCTINIVNIVTNKIQINLAKGSNTTGTITRIIYQFSK